VTLFFQPRLIFAARVAEAALALPLSREAAAQTQVKP
jgi:hypothetical protein